MYIWEEDFSVLTALAESREFLANQSGETSRTCLRIIPCAVESPLKSISRRDLFRTVSHPNLARRKVKEPSQGQ